MLPAMKPPPPPALSTPPKSGRSVKFPPPAPHDFTVNSVIPAGTTHCAALVAVLYEAEVEVEVENPLTVSTV
jgi:hypothetical protein